MKVRSLSFLFITLMLLSPAAFALPNALSVCSSGDNIVIKKRCRRALGEEPLSADVIGQLSEIDASSCPAGPKGAPGVAGNTGERGLTGPKGLPGTNAIRPSQVIPSGKTVFGILEGPPQGHQDQEEDDDLFYTVYVSLPALAPVAISKNNVIIEPGSIDCPGDIADPQASPGKVCIYPTFKKTVQDIFGAEASTGPSQYGFGIKWNTTARLYSAISAVWAYTAP